MFSSSLIPLQHGLIKLNLRIIAPPLHHDRRILDQFLTINNQRIPPFRPQEIVQQPQLSISRLFRVIKFESSDGRGVSVAESIE